MPPQVHIFEFAHVPHADIWVFEDFCLIPMGTKEVSVAEYIAKVCIT